MNREELLKIAKPILFNSEMVKAILEGRKTVTRRVVKPQPDKRHTHFLGYVGASTDRKLVGCACFGVNEYGGSIKYAKPAYKPGDILYVRETWQNVYDTEWDRDKNQEVKIRDIISNFDDISKTCVGLSTEWSTPMMKPRNKYYVYKVDGIENTDEKWSLRWHPSIHMPKEAARIFLKVTDVRVERLQDITDDGCEKEGLENFCKKCSALFSNCDTCLNDEGIKEDFKELWNSTIKKADLDTYGWDANPYVWVIEFEKVEVE